MNTAQDFTTESMRRFRETDEAREKRRAEFLEIARPNWDNLAERIKQKAIWHLGMAEVQKETVYSVLGLSEHHKEHWSDLEHVVEVLGAEHGFEVKSQWETIPRGWIFKWDPRKGTTEEEGAVKGEAK